MGWLLAVPAFAQTTAVLPPAPQAMAPKAAASGAGAAAAAVVVSRFNVTGNTLLAPERIDALLAPYQGERTAAALKDAAMALQAAFARAGYGGVVAYLPEQALGRDGVVSITVVEGRLARVSTTGQQQVSAARVEASLPALVVGATPRLSRLDAHIQLANDNPARRVDVLLLPGPSRGLVDAQVSVTEKPVQRWTLGLDSTGNVRTGRLRASAAWTHADVSGRDDVLSVQYITSPSQPSAVQVLSAAYRVPLYAQLAAVDLYAGYADIDGGSTTTSAGDLRFVGRSHLVGARATRYLERVGELDQRLAIGLDHRAYLNQCGITGLPEGACGAAGESVAVQPLSVEYTGRWTGDARMSLSASVHHNLQWGGTRSDDAHFESVRAGATPRYWLLRLGWAGAVELGGEWQLHGRMSGQFTPHALVPGEQFGVGGLGSVRGYEEREVAGDRGLFTSLELLAPAGAVGADEAGGQLRWLGFVDAGQVKSRLGTPCLITDTLSHTRCTVASVGAGVQFERSGTSARLFVASARKSAVRTQAKDIGLHFALSHSF